MPLKHATETRLVALLAIVIVLTGFLLSALPQLPVGSAPWGVLCVLLIAYPLFLTPVFRRDRADNLFRLLHWFPALMAGVWLLLQLLSSVIRPLGFLFAGFAWGGTLLAVALGFLFIALFSHQVLRQKRNRMTILLLLFLPYAALTFSGQHARLGSTLTAHLQNFEFPQFSEAFRRQQTPPPLLPDPVAMQPPSHVTGDSVSSLAGVREIPGKPGALPGSGPGLQLLALLMLAGYCATVHRRMVLRIR